MMIVSEVAERQLRALADPTRRDILARTMRTECAVTDLAAHYPMSFAAVQRHVAVLEEAGLVDKRHAHRHRYVRARPQALDDLIDELSSIRSLWHERVERMHDVLAGETGGS